MTPRRAPEAVLVALAEAADHFMTMSHLRGSLSQEAMAADIALGECVMAYRAAVAPLRTRAEVDAELCGAIREYMRLRYQLDNTSQARLRDMWEHMSELCSEPTADETEPNATTDHGADLRDPEKCGCEETEALKRKLADIGTEFELWEQSAKGSTATLSAMGLILREP